MFTLSPLGDVGGTKDHVFVFRRKMLSFLATVLVCLSKIGMCKYLAVVLTEKVFLKTAKIVLKKCLKRIYE